MRVENRIDFTIPGETEVAKGFRFIPLLFEASPGDMIVENINNAPSSRFLKMERRADYPVCKVFPGLMEKVFSVKGWKTDKEYIIHVTEEGILTETGDFLTGNVERTVAMYHDFKLKHKDISDFLRRFLV